MTAGGAREERRALVPTRPEMMSELGRVPPQAPDAERSVLGAMLLSRDAIAVATNWSSVVR